LGTCHTPCVTGKLKRDQLLDHTGVPRLVRPRREFLHRHLTTDATSTLEIGALNSPTIRPGECDTYFLDWYSTAELREKYRDNPRHPVADLVDVDYVAKSRDLSNYVTKRVDLAMAHHVLEHVPDPIHFLAEIHRCTTPDGRLFMAIPDREYTFDMFRPVSDAVSMVIANRERRELHTADDIARHLYYSDSTPVTHTDVWEGRAPDHFEPRMTIDDALEQAEQLAVSYADIHAWVFTAKSFRQTFAALTDSGYVDWEIEAFEEVEEGWNEIKVLLRKK
jgi:SAM-dependent methyltransferase